MKSTTLSRQHLLFSLAILLCMTLASGWTFAQSTDDGDRPQRQRQFQNGERGQLQGQGQGQGQARRGGQRGPFGQLLKELQLTEEQQTQVREIMKKHHERVETFREKNDNSFRELQGQIRDAIQDKDYDKLHSLIDQLKTVQADRPTIKELANDIRGVLTDDQKATFDAKIEEAKKNRGKHMRRGQGRHGEENAEGGRRLRRGEGGPRRGQDAPDTDVE